MSGEFPAVAATNQNVNNSSAFAEALERARQVSLKEITILILITVNRYLPNRNTSFNHDRLTLWFSLDRYTYELLIFVHDILIRTFHRYKNKPD